MNKLAFYVDKLHLQEASCRSCFHPRVYITCFLESTFNSQVSTPDTSVLGEALLSSQTPIKKNKENLFCSPFSNLLLKLCFTWNYCASLSRMKCWGFGKQTNLFAPAFWTLLWMTPCERGQFSHWSFSSSIS